MRVLVVGGYGYIGSIVCDMLVAGGHQVSIIDKCLWGNNDVKKFIRPAKHYEDLITLEQSQENPEVVVWAANIDSFEFYEICGEKILNDREMTVEALSSKYRVINCSSYILSYDDNFPDHPVVEHFHKIEKIITKNNGINLRIPSIHGPSPRMRWDTVANEIYLSMVLQKMAVLENDWLTPIPLCNVFDIACKICEVVFDSTLKLEHDYCTEKYNLLEIAHIISKVFDEPINIQVRNKPSVRIGIYSFKNETSKSFKSLTESMEQIKKNMQKNNLPDFLNDKYNNEAVIRCARSGRNLINYLGA